MKAQKKIFVTGITGNQGNAVADHMLEGGDTVLGLTRNSNSDKAKKLKDRGVTIIEGNLDEAEWPDCFVKNYMKKQG